MKKILFCLVILTLVFSVVPARAQEVAVINLEEVINNSTAMNKVKKKLEAKKADMEKKLKVEEKGLTDEKTALESQIKVLSQDVAQEKVTAFQNKVIAFQDNVKKNENELQKGFMDAYLKVTNSVKDIIVEMKNEKNTKYTFNVVIPKASTLYNDQNIDISAEVLARLNKKLKEIK
ncbi:MAG TPA: OmpH family outer membrane protein [Rickettsiales bacterium]|nr:OmpH family outer membrane protein [Rickettsiales bacterium]